MKITKRKFDSEYGGSMDGKTSKQNTPTILVVFGATGDLMRRKIAPSLLHLFEKEELPSLFHVVAFSRRDIDSVKFRDFIQESLVCHQNSHKGQKIDSDFLNLFSYHRGGFGNRNDYLKLAEAIKAINIRWGVCANKLFYIAAPPHFYATIFKNLASSGLTKPCDPKEGWTRIIVEKPFGKDLKTSVALEGLLSKLFKEVQIYRVDHYLAKEMLQNILVFRFANSLFEQSWNKDFIEKIEIRVWEKIGVEKRGSFYDGLGTLRDVGQNHLLQMLALVTMEHPGGFFPDAIRSKREKILKTLIAPSREEIKNFTFRAQYENFRAIPGVKKNSQTETYFKTRVFLSASNWRGVPIILESGKRLKEQRKEIVITFKHPAPCFCPPGRKHYKNKIIIRLEPKEQITMQFWSKKPGFAFETEKRDLSFLLRKESEKMQYTEEYEKLLLDCIAGDQTLFVSSEEVKAMWRYIDPITKAWQKNITPLMYYKPDTNEPIVASSHIEEAILTTSDIKKEIGIIGLGKMGGNLALQLMEKGWYVVGYNKTRKEITNLEKDNLKGANSPKDVISNLSSPRVIWLMVPAGKPVDEVLFGKDGISQHLSKGDIVVDGGNSFYKDSVRRHKKLKREGIHFMDVGISGGPEGARHGASLMIGGEKVIFKKLEPLFYDLAEKNGYQFFEGSGAGHFTKMIHNGIEYGMMQAIAEGFTVLKKSKYKLNLSKIADVYNRGSVIESKLIGWLQKAFQVHGENLQKVSGSVKHTGEGYWTVKTAGEMKIKVKIIEEALKFRVFSEKNPGYTGKILSALREQFGGHDVKKK